MNTKKMLPLFVLVPVVVVLGVALGVLNHADTEEENTCTPPLHSSMTRRTQAPPA